jgi:hypothetical protein
MHMNKQRRGGSLIEATLVLMLVLTLFFSIFDTGYVLFEHHTLLHQARTAARYAAINPDDLPAIRNMVLYGNTAAPHGNPPGVFGLESSMVSVEREDDWTPEDRIVITVSGYRYTLITPFIAGAFTGRPISVSAPVETQ